MEWGWWEVRFESYGMVRGLKKRIMMNEERTGLVVSS